MTQHLCLTGAQLTSFLSSPVSRTHARNVRYIWTMSLEDFFMSAHGRMHKTGQTFISSCASFNNLAYLRLCDYPYSHLGAMANAIGPTILELVITVLPPPQRATRSSETLVIGTVPSTPPQTLRFCLLRALRLDESWNISTGASWDGDCQSYLWDVPMLQELEFSPLHHSIADGLTKSRSVSSIVL